MKLIPLTQGKFAKVDDEDYDYLMQFKWCAFLKNNIWYANRRKNKTSTSMHREVLGLIDPEIFGDHKNHNGLDNQKHNLRIATPRQNSFNRHKRKNSSSKYKGVSLMKKTRKDNTILYYWQARCQLGNIDLALYAQSEIEAAKLYNELALKLHGEFAVLNDII